MIHNELVLVVNLLLNLPGALILRRGLRGVVLDQGGLGLLESAAHGVHRNLHVTRGLLLLEAVIAREAHHLLVVLVKLVGRRRGSRGDGRLGRGLEVDATGTGLGRQVVLRRARFWQRVKDEAAEDEAGELVALVAGLLNCPRGGGGSSLGDLGREGLELVGLEHIRDFILELLLDDWLVGTPVHAHRVRNIDLNHVVHSVLNAVEEQRANEASSGDARLVRCRGGAARPRRPRATSLGPPGDRAGRGALHAVAGPLRTAQAPRAAHLGGARGRRRTENVGAGHCAHRRLGTGACHV
mmetsp:Transcript_723/g.2316  ORF Transcript_723/g.2316 Transcript_723/m.2316 type:complete len:297 (-) Transcript_723:84-974(-)